MDNKKEIIVELNPNNIGKLQTLINNKIHAESLLNDFVTTVLDAKEIDYSQSNVSLIENNTKIKVEQINQTPG